MNIPIYIAVFTEQNRHFNMFGQGYLPLFHTIFSLSKVKDKVFNEVYKKLIKKPINILLPKETYINLSEIYKNIIL
jgi:hypothetical protein